ncbi:SDR family NAD(P)-dependent oxidoreductase [Seohaeicola saemankumensis]|nr:SDR family NAD(P)-dependent oxidoreductase [Seohaeicola saemankumensis]MCA0869595.1 SDR family NAD(P)-dependent oxidoreductase [Seohaeicola saemankumensis]
MTKLNGQTAWITGGGSGIGAAGARALAASGATVVLSGRRAEPLEAVAEEIRGAGGQASVVPLDTADAAAVRAAAEAIGPVDILVASAGLNVPDRSMTRVTDEGWDKVVGVNLNGVFYTARAVLPGMRAKGGGTLILISSWAGRYATRLTGAAYNASKRAVIALNESINDEEGGNGIRSTVIMPGEVATDILKTRPSPPSQAEMDRMLSAEDLGDTIRFVAEMPARACLNEILISPTWNRFYQGFDEL